MKAIEFHGVSKKFIVRQEKPRSFQEVWLGLFRPRGDRAHEVRWAVRDVDLEVEVGETLGIIGANGAGKTTILRLMARILKPSEGSIVVRGHALPLLDLLAGFHPDLTGRENLYLTGSLLGLSRNELNGRFSDIVEFSELEPLIDTPLRSWSTGMILRLGFSVVANVEADILLVDEVLSVGDEAFQRKSWAKMESFKASSTTMALVSHDLAAVRRLCDRVIWLDAGQIRAEGRADSVIDRYLNQC